VATNPPTVSNIWKLALRFREPRLLVAVAAAMAGLVALAQLPLRPVLVRAGMAVCFWFAFEYFFHRFVLHFLSAERAARYPFLRRGPHWRHHQTPGDLPLAFTPWWALCLLLVGTFAAGWMGAQAPGAVGATLGMSVMLFVYETVHMSAHAPYVPRTAWGAFMRRGHLLHHFHNERGWFGVTHPIFDWALGTWKAVDELPRSPTARTLGER
jgi:4-hydroxysphinganine ceramide fatty acyl 2-hydroxylase